MGSSSLAELAFADECSTTYPSCEKRFSPQLRTSPDLVRASVWSWPKATDMMVCSK